MYPAPTPRSLRIFTIRRSLCFFTLALGLLACQPDESPFKAEIERLQKEAKKQEGVIMSLQDGNKVMQQQINLLNEELRDAKKDVQRLETERTSLTAALAAQHAQSKKLAADAQRIAAKKAEAIAIFQLADKAGQVEEFPKSLSALSKAAEEALQRYGYTVKVSVKDHQRAVYVTDRKVSAPASLEVPGFRNQYVLSLQAVSSTSSRLSVKAEFERMAQGNRVLAAGPEETAEIERRLIAEIAKALNAPGKA